MLLGEVGGFADVFGEIEEFGSGFIWEGEIGLDEFPVADLDGTTDILFVVLPVEVRVSGLIAFSKKSSDV